MRYVIRKQSNLPIHVHDTYDRHGARRQEVGAPGSTCRKTQLQSMLNILTVMPESLKPALALASGAAGCQAYEERREKGRKVRKRLSLKKQ